MTFQEWAVEQHRKTNHLYDDKGNLFILCSTHIRKINKDGIIDSLPIVINDTDLPIKVVAGNKITCDTAGNIYYSDVRSDVYKIDAQGIRIKIAGADTFGFNGENGLADTIALNMPRGLTVDDSGRLYIADYRNALVRRINTKYRFPEQPVISGDTSGTVHIFPNPAFGDIRVKFYSKQPGNVYIQLLDAAGKRIDDILIITTNGYVDERLVLPAQLPQGVYFIRIIAPSVKCTSRFVIAR